MPDRHAPSFVLTAALIVLTGVASLVPSTTHASRVLHLADLLEPTSLSSDESGNVYAVYGDEAQAIARVSPHGLVQRVIGRPNAPLERAGYFGGQAIDATTCGIADLLSAPDGRVWFTESGDSLRVVEPSGVVDTPISPTPLDFSSESCPHKIWTRSVLDRPHGLARAPDGRIVVASAGASQLLFWDRDSATHTTLSTGDFTEPAELAARGDGTYFFGNHNSVNRIGGNCIAPCSVYNKKGYFGSAGDDWPALEAQARNITGLTGLPGDTFLLTDPEIQRVRRVGPLPNRMVETIVGGGAGSVGSDQDAIELSAPQDAEAIAAGLVVSERTTNRLLLVDKTTINGAPPAMTSQRAWTLGVESWYNGPTFSCRIDGAEWEPCSATLEIAPATDGDHVLEARGTDHEGTDPTPAEVRWTLDTVAPHPFEGTSPNADATVHGKPVLRWAPSQDATSGIERYDVVVDGSVVGTLPATGCASECTWQPETALGEGHHEWKVRATDRAGHARETPPRALTVDTVAPKAFDLEAPANLAYLRQLPASLSWNEAVDVSPVTYEVTIDGAWLDATTERSVTVPDLGQGEHRWRVEAIDAAGNRTLASERRFVLDTRPPTTTLSRGPTVAWTNATVASFQLASDDPEAGFECLLDDVPIANCGGTVELDGLQPGEHRLQAVAVDPAGNRDPSPINVVWSVDVAPPGPPSLAEPEAGRTGVRAEVVLRFIAGTDSDSGLSEHEVLLDGTRIALLDAADCPAGECTVRPPQALGHGPHSWRVVTTDHAGNAVDAIAAFTVDALAPRAHQLLSPALGARLRDSRPDLTWAEASDEGSGVSGYEVTLDGASSRATASLRFPIEAPLRDGPHTWSVVALDRTGNRSAPTSGSFHVDTTPPLAALRRPPRVVAGLTVTLDASESRDPDGGRIVLYEFDLDGDGAFEHRTQGPTAQRAMAKAGTQPVRVRVTDEVGLTATAETMAEAEDPPLKTPLRPVTVTVNDGAFATRSLDVQLDIRPPLRTGASLMAISNDGALAEDVPRHPIGAEERLRRSWRLMTGDNAKTTRNVYVFFFNAGGRQVGRAEDDIVFDPTRPVIQRATVVRRSRTHAIVRIRVRDRGSGVRYVDATVKRGTSVRKYLGNRRRATASLRVRVRRGQRVRVSAVDRAGNRTSRAAR